MRLSLRDVVAPLKVANWLVGASFHAQPYRKSSFPTTMTGRATIAQAGRYLKNGGIDNMATVTVTNAERDSTGAIRTSPVSASASAGPLSWPTITWPMLAVVAAAVIMCLVYRYWIKPIPIRFSAGYLPYAGVVAAAGALERFLEPLSKWLMPTEPSKKQAAASKTNAEEAAADPQKSATAVQQVAADAARDQATVDGQRTARAIVFWAIASICGLAISGGFGFFLLRSVAISHVNPYLDLAITGLTIGAGTKPTHDFITSIQAKASKPS